MAKITLPSIGGGYATTTQLNAAFTQIEDEFQNKVLYRNNTSAESNVMENDIDLNNNDLNNVGLVDCDTITVAGVSLTAQVAAAAASATAAAASAAAAAVSASTASSSAATSTASATAAGTSATNAAASAASATASAATATTQAALATTNGAAQVALATTQATNAATSASAASTSASAASTSATNASTSASSASTSATTATTQASNASTSATNAAASATAAAASYDAFDDRYLGSFATAPTLDNDGNPLLTGAIYWNTVGTQLYIWTGSAWSAAAFSISGSVTTVSGGTTGLTPATATSGAITLAGTLGTANGGTGSTSTTYANLASNVTGTLPIANGGTGSTATAHTSLTTNVTGTLPVANGGTNSTATATAGGAGYGTGTAHAYTAAGTTGQALISAGASAPSFGTLGVAGGGTGLATLTANNVLLGNGTSAPTFVAPSTTGNLLTSNGTTWVSSAAPSGARSGSSNITLNSGTLNVTLTAASNQVQIISANAAGVSVTLPDATTMTKGAGYFVFFNASSGPIAIKDNGGTIREFLYPNTTTGAGVPLLLTDNSTANGIFRLGNPTLYGAANSNTFTSTDPTLTLTTLKNIVQVSSTQYVFVSIDASNYHAYKLGTINLTTGVWTFGPNVACTAWTRGTWSGTYHSGDSNGSDRGIIGYAYGTNYGSAQGYFEGFGFGIVSGVLYITAKTTFYITDSTASPATYCLGGLMYAGADNCFMIYGYGVPYSGYTTNGKLSGFKVNISGTTVSLVEATTPYNGAAVGYDNYEFLFTSPTTAVSDNTNGAAYAKYHSYNTSTNTITTGARTTYTTRTSQLNTAVPYCYSNAGFNVYTKSFFGTTRMIMNEDSTALAGTLLTTSNVGTASVNITLTTGGSYNSKPLAQSNYATSTTKITPRRIFVNSATSHYILDTLNSSFFKVDPTDSNLSANVGTFLVTPAVWCFWTSSNAQILLIKQDSTISSINSQLITAADPFIA